MSLLYVVVMKIREEIKALLEVLNSQEIKDFLLEQYKGAVIPANQ